MSNQSYVTETKRDPNVDSCVECGGPTNDSDAGITAQGEFICGDCATQDISIDRDNVRYVESIEATREKHNR